MRRILLLLLLVLFSHRNSEAQIQTHQDTARADTSAIPKSTLHAVGVVEMIGGVVLGLASFGLIIIPAEDCEPAMIGSSCSENKSATKVNQIVGWSLTFVSLGLFFNGIANISK